MTIVKIPATIRKRRWIQRQRKVTTDYIDAILYNALPPGHHKIFYKLFGHKNHQPRP